MAENVSWEQTRDILQPLIKAPKLTEKLLLKPPFRFLHDIITNLIKQQHVYDGLYNADEMDSAKVTDRDSKVAFLQKIISAVQFAMGIQLAVRPLKVVSGLEPEATNAFLQALAQSVKDKCDWKSAVEKTLGGGGDDKKKEEKKKEEKKDREKEKKEEKDEKKEEKKEEKKDREKDKDREKEKDAKDKDKDKDRDKDREKEKEREKRKEKEKEEREKEKEKEKREKEKRREEEKKEERKAEPAAPPPPPPPAAAPPPVQPTADISRQDRPSTARKPPPQVKSNVVETEAAPVLKDKKDAPLPSGVIIDKKKGKDTKAEDSDDDMQPTFEPMPEVARTEEAAEGGGGWLSKKAEQAVKETEKKGADPTSPLSPTAGTGIILSRAIGGGKKERESLQQEISKLRDSLQTLTKATNPLGKAMDYIQEDIDSMQRELEMWKAEAKQQNASWLEQQRQTEEVLQPLYSQLHDLEDSITDQIMKIHSVKAGIIRYDQTVDTLLKMVVTSGQRPA